MACIDFLWTGRRIFESSVARLLHIGVIRHAHLTLQGFFISASLDTPIWRESAIFFPLSCLFIYLQLFSSINFTFQLIQNFCITYCMIFWFLIAFLHFSSNIFVWQYRRWQNTSTEKCTSLLNCISLFRNRNSRLIIYS